MKALFVIFLLFVSACGGAEETFEEDCDPAASAEVCRVFEMVNQERVSLSLQPLKWDSLLAVSADAHAKDMSDQNYFDHTSRDGRNFSDRAKDAGYTASPTGENIAFGQQTASSVMESWMNSDGHRSNILSAKSNEIGVGLRSGYWVQVFGSR